MTVKASEHHHDGEGGEETLTGNDVVLPRLDAWDHELDLPCAQIEAFRKGMI